MQIPRDMATEQQKAFLSEPAVCLHCGLPVPAGRQSEAEQLFCCSGCEKVYNLINGLGLGDFYDYRRSAAGSPLKPASASNSDFSCFADAKFIEHFTKKEEGGARSVMYYLPEMHCAACVWLVEKLPGLVSGVLEARVDYSSSAVLVRYNEERTSPVEAARMLHALGYTPYPREISLRQKVSRQMARDYMLRLGIAGVAAGNSMMFAVSLYQGWFSGMEAQFRELFLFASMVVSLPAVFYSAVPVYRAAAGGLRVGVLHIDLPISMAIILGTAVSVVNTVRGSFDVYFDSICTLIFLLLLARWFQRKELEKSSLPEGILASVIPITARKITGERTDQVYAASLMPGDVIEVLANEVIPADGRVCSGESFINAALVTGESRPRHTVCESEVFAGCMNLTNALKISTTAAGEQTRIGRLLKRVEEESYRPAPLVSITSKLSGWFVALIILLAFSGGVFWWIHSGLYAALNSVLALLIVSCPCALALAAPVALSVGVRKAARLGVYIRGSETIEKLASAETIFLDKTGTITEGKMTVQEAICLLPGGDVVDFPEADAGLQRKIAEAVCLLERHSPHPAAAALIEYLRPSAAVLPEGWQTEEITGKGVRAHDAHGLEWRIGSWPWVKEQISLPAAQFDAAASAYAGQGLTPAALGHDGAVYALFALGDPVREGMRQAVQELRQDGRRCVILSGDDVQVVRSVALRLNIDEADIYAGLSPEEKTEIVIRANKQEMCAMTGDGLNDAGALQAASVAIGVSGGAEACLKIAQVFLSRPDAGNLALAFLGSRAVIRVIKLNFAISIIYNMCGAGLALCGLMNPLLAAVLMPLSSISVVISSVFGRTYFR